MLLSYRCTIAWLRRGRDAAIENVDETGEQLCFVAFENDADLAPEVTLGVRCLDGDQYPIFSQLTAGAEAAVKFVEVAFGPVAEHFRMVGGTGFHERVGGAIELQWRDTANWLKKLVDRHAQTLSQLVHCAGVRIANAASEASDCSLVELGGGDHLFERQVVAGHNAAQIAGDSGGVAIDRRYRGQRNMLANTRLRTSHRPAMYKRILYRYFGVKPCPSMEARLSAAYNDGRTIRLLGDLR
jgi:hypothetical protein